MIYKDDLVFVDYPGEICHKDIAELMANKKMNYKTRDLKFYKDKYNTLAYSGLSMKSKLVYYKGKLVAHCAAFPMKTMVNGTIYNTVSIGDLIVDPSARGHGLASKMIASIIESSKKSGFPFIYTVPNKVSNDIFIKLKFEKRTENMIYTINVKTLPVLKLFNKLKLTSSFTSIFKLLTRKRVTSRNTIHFNNSLIDEGYDGIIRDNEYYKYKVYGDNFIYKFNDGLIWFKIDDGFVIGDISINDTGNIDSLMNEFKRFTRKCGIHKIKIFSTKKGTLFNYFERNHSTCEIGINLLIYPIDKKIELDNWYTNIPDYNTF